MASLLHLGLCSGSQSYYKVSLCPMMNPGFISRRHQSDGLLGGHPQLRANLRGAQSPQRYTAKSSLEEELKKLITLDSPPPCEDKVLKGLCHQWLRKEKRATITFRTKPEVALLSILMSFSSPSSSEATVSWSAANSPFAPEDSVRREHLWWTEGAFVKRTV